MRSCVDWKQTREVLPALEGYADWMVTTRDEDGTGMIDVTPPLK